MFMSAKSKMVPEDAQLSTERSPPSVASNPTVENSSPELITQTEVARTITSFVNAYTSLHMPGKSLIFGHEAKFKMVPKDDRLSTERSPPSVASNPTVENSSPELITQTEKLAKGDRKKAHKKFVLLGKKKVATLCKNRAIVETLFAIQAENKKYKTHIEDLQSDMEAKDDHYRSTIDALTDSIERSRRDYDYLKRESERKESHLTNALKRSEEERSCMEFEISRLDNLVKTMKKEVESAKLSEAKESTKNDEVRRRLSVQIEVLTNLLAQALPATNDNKQEEEYDVLPEWTRSVHINEDHVELCEFQKLDGEIKKCEENGDGDEEFSERESEMWERLSGTEEDSYAENDASITKTMKKKKRPLLGKIGSLLKKGTSD